MAQRFNNISMPADEPATVPQIREGLVKAIADMQDDVVLAEAVAHVWQAIAALDCAQALAFSVLRECEQGRHKLC